MDSKPKPQSFLILRESDVLVGVDGKKMEIQLRESEQLNTYGLKEYYVYFSFDKHIYYPVEGTTSFAFAENAYNFIVDNPEIILNETHNLFVRVIEERKQESIKVSKS